MTAPALPKEGGMNPITAKIVIGGAVIAATPPRTPAMVERVRGASIRGRGQMKGIGIRLGISILRRATPLHHLATPALKRATTSTGSHPPALPTITTPPKIATNRPKETTDNTEAARQRTVATTKIEAIATDPARVVAPPTGTTDTDPEQVVTLPETTGQGVARDTETASVTVSAHRGATVIVTTGSTGEAEIREMMKRGSRGRGVRMLLSGEKL